MAFPTTANPTTTTFATSVTSMNVNMPGSIVAGDLLIASVGVRNPGNWTPPSGWNLLLEQPGGGSVGETVVWYKIADGSEGATLAWSTSVGTTGAWHVYKISNWHGTTPPEVNSVSGDAVAVNPPSLTASWGAEDNLWIALAGSSANGMFFGTAPTNYSGLSSTTAGSGGGASNMGSARRSLNAATEDPGAFASTTNRWWRAVTIVIRPAGSTPPSSNTKVKVSGSFDDATPKVKVSGSFVDVTPKHKSGGVFS